MKKQFALNKLFNVCIIVGLLLSYSSILCFTDSEILWGLFFGIMSVLFIVLTTVFSPYCYAFDSEGVSLCYIFLPVERYLWKDIRSIEVDIISGGTRTNIFSLLYDFVFKIDGKNVGKTRFYMSGHIRKSFRTKYLLEKYWNKTITGYLFEDTKKWIGKKRAQKQAHIKAHMTDEIVLLERSIRANARDWLKPITEQAKHSGLDVNKKYFYVTKSSKKSVTRPKEDYTYTLVLEILPINEQNKDKAIILDVDLLYVRLTKTSYRGVENKNAQEELTFAFSDVLNQINS